MLAGAKRVLVEVCVASARDARVATAGGADRIELNAALELGGLTPSPGTVNQTREATALPAVAMLRPRPGGFGYDADEFNVMLRDAELLIRHGADGLAFGILTPEGRVDVERCHHLIDVIRSAGRPLREGFVFHRAFDFVADRAAGLEQLIGLGFRRVMTSGGARSAVEGAGEIATLVRRATGRVEILPAGGIRGSNVRSLVSATGCDQVHASVRRPRRDPSVNRQSSLALGSPGEEHFCTDAELLADLVSNVQ